MSSTPILPTPLHDFKKSLQGTLIEPGDERYETARRVWNGLIDKHPACIVVAADVSDVISSIQFAHDQALPIAVRGGGHGLSGYAVCDDGIVVDLSQMKEIHVDPQQAVARVEPGCTNADVLRATQPYGLAMPTGIVADVGIAGLTLGGGEGWISGKYGLACDSLLAVEMITADGKPIRASLTEHPDLFWAVRGAGANFGIVTAFVFQLYPVGQVLRASVSYPLSQAGSVLRLYRQFTWQRLTDELTVYADLVTVKNGQPIVMLNACYCGDDLAEGERLLTPLHTFGSPLFEMTRPMSLLESAMLLNDSFPSGRFIYPQTETVSLSDEVIDSAIAYTLAHPSPFCSTGIRHTHGAATRVEPAATAFALRSEHYVMQIMAQWTQGGRQPYVDWADHFHADIAPFAQSLVPVNWLGEVSQGRVQAGYGSNYELLAQIKRSYDPTNFFHMNQNIEPAK